MTETEQPEQPQPDEAANDFRVSPLRLFWSLGSKLRVGIAVAVGGLLLLGVILYATSDDGPTPHEELEQALELIDRRDDADAQADAVNIARRLRKSGYRDLGFAGGTEYILGMAAFRNAKEQNEAGRDQWYVLAARELKRCETLALDKSRRPEWSFALGASLYEIGKASEALPLLEEAVETYPPSRVESATRLVDIYLDLKTPDALGKAIPLITMITNTKGLRQSQYDGAYLRSAQVFLTLNRRADAEEALTHVSEDTRGNQGTIVFRAQTFMVEGESLMAEARSLTDEARDLSEEARQAVEQKENQKAADLKTQAGLLSDQALLRKKEADAKYRDAMQLLEPVANEIGLVKMFARQASYLLGVCFAAINDVDAAISNFEKTADKYPGSHEALAANLRAGDLLRRVGRSEEALNKRYRKALEMVTRSEDFRNRWLSLKQFRERIRTAWNEWIEQNAYQEAITLSKMMPPLFESASADELTARANRRWAEYLGQQLEHATYSQREKLQKPYRERWRMSGKAHAVLAEARKTSADYSTALRVSAEHFRLGHDFPNSLIQWTRFIDTHPKSRLPEALVNRGKVLMDLDRLDDALSEFQWVIDNHPTDAAAFEAQYLLGTCHLERSEPELAEKVWREIITSDTLTPAAKQWQLALVSLGRLLYHTAAMKQIAAESPRSKLTAEESQALLDEAFARWDESIRHLELFLAFVAQKKIQHPEAVRAQKEARYLLAKALRHTAEQPRRKLESAETENARLELRRTMQQLLGQARDEYRKLQAELLDLEELDMLDELEQRLLRDCYFEVAHTYYALAGYGIDAAEENYKKAIVAYSSAANKYSRDPQVILAYLQIANCNERLGKPSDARSSLEQARVILKQMSDDAFQQTTTNMTKAEWQEWLIWVQNLRQHSLSAEIAQP